MDIESLEIKGLHGYIDKFIDFNNDLTILVGINGSGKTSVLNLINWITKPMISELATLEFKKIILKLNHNNVKYTITCTQLQSNFSLLIQNDKGDKFFPLIVRRRINPKDIFSEDQKREIINYYARLQPVGREKKTLEIISSFPKATIISLDRDLYIEDDSAIYIDRNGLINQKINKKAISPLEKVKEIVNTEYRKRRNDILNLTNDLKNYLIYSTFDTGVITVDAIHSSPKNRINAESIKTAQNKVKEYFEKLAISEHLGNEKNVLNNYFEQLSELLRIYSENRNNKELQLLYTLNSVQFKKINKILKKFEEFEQNSSNTFSTINKFLEVTNFFLKDSSKQLVFKEDTAEITFNALDKNNKKLLEYKDISHLSSGERQILILFSYVAFNSYDGRIFIIDEPELSLHIKWQEDFLEQLKSISPKSTQIILATHSPILVNNSRDKVKLLFPFNN